MAGGGGGTHSIIPIITGWPMTKFGSWFRFIAKNEWVLFIVIYDLKLF